MTVHLKSASISDLIMNTRLIVCAGSGGVGKTTTAAAIALQAAAMGRKTLVLTIDPAKRLAQSLGLEGLGNDERAVPEDKLKEAGITSGGTLYAAMLDTKASMDQAILRVTQSKAQAERILNNHVYRQMSDALAGSQEYAAMERLYELMEERDYDLVVLDTPPTANALDFLNAPNRLASFLDEGIVKWFVGSSGRGIRSRLFKQGGAVVFKLLGILLGESLIKDLSEFFQAFNGLYDGFKSRAEKVNRLLRDPKTVFLLITAAEKNALDEARFFREKLKEAGIPLRAVIVNRAYQPTPKTPFDTNDFLELIDKETSGEPEALRFRLADKLATVNRLARRLNSLTEQNIAHLAKRLDVNERLALIPIFSDEIVDIQGLLQMSQHLFQTEPG